MYNNCFNEYNSSINLNYEKKHTKLIIIVHINSCNDPKK